jgi:hypothetical protein
MSKQPMVIILEGLILFLMLGLITWNAADIKSMGEELTELREQEPCPQVMEIGQFLTLITNQLNYDYAQRTGYQPEDWNVPNCRSCHGG